MNNQAGALDMEQQPENEVENKKENGYLYITWGGAAVVLNSSPAHIQGCFTEGLTTCMCITVIGEHGFVFLHDTLFVSEISIERLFTTVGRVKKLIVIYNQNNYPDFSDLSVETNAHLKKLLTILNKISHFECKEYDNVSLHKTSDGFVSISRIASFSSSLPVFSYHVNTTTPPSHMISLPFMILRLEINNLNWFFTYPGEGVPCDLHYNGHEYLNLPKFMKTPDEMQTLIHKHQEIFEAESKVPGSEMTRKQLTAQHRAKIPYLIQEREQALRNRNVLISPPIAQEREKMFQQRDSQDFVNTFLAKQRARSILRKENRGIGEQETRNEPKTAPTKTPSPQLGGLKILTSLGATNQ